MDKKKDQKEKKTKAREVEKAEKKPKLTQARPNANADSTPDLAGDQQQLPAANVRNVTAQNGASRAGNGGTEEGQDPKGKKTKAREVEKAEKLKLTQARLNANADSTPGLAGDQQQLPAANVRNATAQNGDSRAGIEGTDDGKDPKAKKRGAAAAQKEKPAKKNKKTKIDDQPPQIVEYEVLPDDSPSQPGPSGIGHGAPPHRPLGDDGTSVRQGGRTLGAGLAVTLLRDVDFPEDEKKEEKKVAEIIKGVRKTIGAKVDANT